jgi:predicted aldo/keto reductase-like oxidoreductase
MKKIVFAAIIFLSVVLGACKHNVSTQYTIGCLGYQYGTVEESDWQALEDYFKTHVEFNKVVTFEGNSLAENDKQARELFDEQMAKIDADYVCTLLGGTDYYIYGIATLNAGGDYRYVKAMKFAPDGATEVTD